MKEEGEEEGEEDLTWRSVVGPNRCRSDGFIAHSDLTDPLQFVRYSAAAAAPKLMPKELNTSSNPQQLLKNSCRT